MSSWKRVALVLGGLAVLGGAAAAALAAGRGHHGRYFQKMISARIDYVLDEIDATPEQRQTINKVKDDVLAQLQARAGRRAQQHEQWIALLTAPSLTVDQLNTEADTHLDEMRAFVKGTIVPALKTVHDVLTPAQREKLAELAKERHLKMQSGFGGQ